MPTPKRPHLDPGPSATAAAPPAAPPPPALDAAQRAARGADALAWAYVPARLAAALGMPAQFDAAACQKYLDDFVAQAGGPSDPVERVLLEQVAIGHLRLADLHGQTAAAPAAEAAKAYAGAAAHLLGEIRRTALALREYQGRTPKPALVRLAQAG